MPVRQYCGTRRCGAPRYSWRARAASPSGTQSRVSRLTPPYSLLPTLCPYCLEVTLAHFIFNSFPLEGYTYNYYYKRKDLEAYINLI